MAPQRARADHRLRARAGTTLGEERSRWQYRESRSSHEAGRSSSRWRGIRSPASSATSASTRRSTSTNREVVECKSTSSLFRGYSVFMKGKDPRDAHFITSRICGICGDNHATCSVLRAEHGVRHQAAAAGGVDRQPRRGGRVHVRPHRSSRTTWCSSTSASRWSRRRTRACWQKAEKTEAPHAELHGYRTIARHHALVQPVHGRDLPRGAADEPDHAGDVLPDGGAPRAPVHDLPGRRGHRGHADSCSPTTSPG